MSAPSYAVPGLSFGLSSTFSPQVQDLQSDLRALGYVKGPIDGMFGMGTQNGVKALQYDLMNNNGASRGGDGSAPVAIKDYNKGRVSGQTGIVDQAVVACIVAMLGDAAYPKLPFSLNPLSDNQNALAAVKAMFPSKVPIPFLLPILFQESGGQHFQVPSKVNRDHFVTVGLDHNQPTDRTIITSRGYGIGQFTLFHHPPTAAEVANSIADPVRNVARAVTDLLEKYEKWVAGPVDTAEDRIREFGTGPLRPCQFPASDPRYMKACSACFTTAGVSSITANTTPLYEGSSEVYTRTQYHAGSYSGVPIRKNIPCDWVYAIRRYNGSGVNSYDYQAEVLQKAASLK